jgi:predicted RNA-binding protein with PIN domain
MQHIFPELQISHVNFAVAIEETVETFVETVVVILTAETGVLITSDPNAHINIVESQATRLTNAGREFEMKATTKTLDTHQPS